MVENIVNAAIVFILVVAGGITALIVVVVDRAKERRRTEVIARAERYLTTTQPNAGGEWSRGQWEAAVTETSGSRAVVLLNGVVPQSSPVMQKSAGKSSRRR